MRQFNDELIRVIAVTYKHCNIKDCEWHRTDSCILECKYKNSRREDTAILRILCLADGSTEFTMFTKDGKTELGRVTIQNAKESIIPFLEADLKSQI